MLLDKLLRHIVVHVEPFATCLVDSGWRLRLPGPPDVMFHFVLQGNGFVREPGGQQHRLERFYLAIVPKGTPHALECGPEIRSERVIETPPTGEGVVRILAGGGPADLRIACGVVSINYGDSLGLFHRLNHVLVADLSPFTQIRSIFETLLAEQSGAGAGSEALTQALMSQCLVYLLRHLSDEPDDSLPWMNGLNDERLGPALDLILDQPGSPHTVALLANASMMSRSSFAERFQEAFGVPPMKFLHDVRLRRAAEMFQKSPELLIDQVARRVGFTSRSHFSREFKRRFGASPTAFRRVLPTPRTLG
jgi:AraC-like DNA-binding protein